MAGSEWLLYAVAAMVLFSLGNIVLKVAVDNVDFSKVRFDLTAPLILVLVAAAVVLYAAFGQIGLSGELLKYAAVFAVVALLGFLALVQSLKSGRVSVVNAVLALSVVCVTGLSAVFLGEKVSLKEIAAMVLAVASILLMAA